MFITRTISGIVLLAVTMCAIIASGPLLYLFMLLISLVGMYELMEKKIPALVGYLTAIGIESVILAGKNDLVVLILVLGFLAMMVSYVATYPKFTAEEIAKATFGMVYVALMMSFIFQTRISNDGAYTVWLIFISAWGCDTCAYLVGRAIGKHKMTPVLSPKKSIEGAVGGIIGYAGKADITNCTNWCALWNNFQDKSD